MKNFFRSSFCLLIISAAALFPSCSVEPVVGEAVAGYDAAPATRSYADEEGLWVPAQVVSNRFSLTNAQLALGQSGGLNTVILLPTHYHVRFRPSTDEAWYALKAGETVDFSPYPLDVEVPEGAVAYVDNDQPEDAPPFLFAAVPVSYSFPSGVAYDILESLYYFESSAGANDIVPTVTPFVVTFRGTFLCEVSKVTDVNNTGGLPGDTDGNPGGSGGVGGSGGSSISFKPSGVVRVWDDLLQQYIPLQGVKVKATGKNTKKSVTMITNAHGAFTTSQIFTEWTTYKIIWEADKYDIRSGTFGQAFYTGPTKSTPWEPMIGGQGNTDQTMRYATIHRGAYRYFYGNTGGLLKIKDIIDREDEPFMYGPDGPYYTDRPGGRGKLKISYYHTSGRAKVFEWYTLSFPKLQIFQKYSNGTELDTYDIFSTTVHELGHASHYFQGRSAFFRCNWSTVESWASFAEWVLTLKEYEERGFDPVRLADLAINHNLGRQAWPYRGFGSTQILAEPEYSGIFIDLVDDFNQSINNNGTNTYPDDNVTGFTPGEVERLLYQASSLESLRDILKLRKPAGVTDAQIDTLLDRYDDYWIKNWIFQ